MREGRVNHLCQIKERHDAPWQSAVAIYPLLQETQPGNRDIANGGTVPDGVASNLVVEPKTPAGRNENANPYAQPISKPYTEPHRGGLILSMGILSFLLPIVIFGIMAWVMGANDLNKMKHEVMDSRGRSLTRLGRNLGIISLLLTFFMLIGMFLLAILFIGVSL